MYKNEISSQDSTKRQEGFLKRNLRGEEGMGNTNTTLKELVSQGLKEQPQKIHPGRLTWNIIMEVWKIIFLSKWVMFRFHVNLPGCSSCVFMFAPLLWFWQTCINIVYFSSATRMGTPHENFAENSVDLYDSTRQFLPVVYDWHLSFHERGDVHYDYDPYTGWFQSDDLKVYCDTGFRRSK